MREIAVFEKEEYIKLMETLEIKETSIDEQEDKSVYFNAWNFGQEKGEFEYSLTTEIK